MYEDLIEQIELLKKECNPVWQNEFDLNTSYNLALNDVLNIIKQAEPPITDKPIGDGWYWLFVKDHLPCVIEVEGKLARYNDGYMMQVENITGKWQKIPEQKEGNNADN